MTGVNGWYSANQRSAAGMESVGTNPLPRKGSSISGMGVLLAVSTLPALMPSATPSQISAKAKTAIIPSAAIHPPTPATGRSPTSSATQATTTTESIVWTMLPSTWPVSTDGRKIAIVRNRVTMPSVMSIAIETEVPLTAVPTVISRIPGAT
jgi:hypothetical protein